jgi:hypothetical protein
MFASVVNAPCISISLFGVKYFFFFWGVIFESTTEDALGPCFLTAVRVYSVTFINLVLGFVDLRITFLTKNQSQPTLFVSLYLEILSYKFRPVMAIIRLV